MDPIRSCIVCRNKRCKKELFRVVCENNKAIYDKEQNINSRGIYLCKSFDCINKCKKYVTKDKFNTKLSINNESMLKVLLDLENELGD
jgi:predicted RNA-binding protein YlxR (DUF448 family)